MSFLNKKKKKNENVGRLWPSLKKRVSYKRIQRASFIRGSKEGQLSEDPKRVGYQRIQRGSVIREYKGGQLSENPRSFRYED